VESTRVSSGFRSRLVFERYRELFESYLRALLKAGVEPVPSALQLVAGQSDTIAWCVQPLLAKDGLLPELMRTGSRDDAVAHFETVLERIQNAVGPSLGVDGQLSNWIMDDGELRYLDVTTPLMRDEDGRNGLDADLFLASLPWALRGMVKRFILEGIIDKYHQPRGVVLDLLGNLIKERLDPLLDPFIARANLRFGDSPITSAEVRRYYTDDARTWAVLQRLRHADRAWQRKVRRRPYAFLLPGPIER
jgi:hypothetical protein